MNSHFIRKGFILVCVHLLLLCGLTETFSCDWPPTQNNAGRTDFQHYHCTPGLYTSFLWESSIYQPPERAGAQQYISIYKNQIYYVEENWLYTRDLDTGEVTSYNHENKYESGITSVIDDKIITFAEYDEDHRLLCGIDVFSHKTLWTYKHDKCEMGYVVVGNSDYVFLSVECIGCLIGLDVDTGEEVWIIDGSQSVPLLSDDKLVLIVDNSLRCYSLETFKMIWAIDMDVFYDEFYSYSISGESLYLLSSNIDEEQVDELHFTCEMISVVHSLNLATGELNWVSDEYVYKDYNPPGLSVNNKYVFLGQGMKMICYNQTDGSKVWSYTDKDTAMNPVIVTEKTIIFSGSSYVKQLSADSGRVINKNKLPDELNLCCGELLISNRRLLFLSVFGGLSCFDGTAKARYQIDSNGYNINDVQYDSDISPLIRNDRTLLSARYVVEPFGGEIDWDSKEKKVTCRLLKPSKYTDDLTEMNIVELWIGKSTAKINGQEVQIDPSNPDVVPTIINDRTMVPMRFLAESLGCEVEWLPETREIVLTYIP